MREPILNSSSGYTYGAYLTWDDEKRYELIEGVVYELTPTPSRKHQRVLSELHLIIGTYLRNKTCQVYLAPFDVRFPTHNESDEDIETVVQPDLSIICDPTKLDDRGCRGAPDVTVEIISPHTKKKDITKKFPLYEKHGVKEYWLVYPLEEIVQVYKLDTNGTYARPVTYMEDESIKSSVIHGLVVDINLVFAPEIH